jgi:hypothetical protein
MSFTDRLVLWLHIAFVIFTIGPVTMTIMSSPRAIRTRNAAVLRHLLVMTRIFAAGSLAVLVFGIVLGQSLHDLGKAWLTASMTLYVVALVLLGLIMRDQRRAIAALAAEGSQPAVPSVPDAAGEGEEGGTGTADAEPEQAAQPGSGAVAAAQVASVERGRIASMGGVVSLLWLAILVLMVWQP